MRSAMSKSLEARFEEYCDAIVDVLMHADRDRPARWYMKGLMLLGERKSFWADGGSGAAAERALSPSVDASLGGSAVE